MDYLQIAECLVRSSNVNSAPDEWPQVKPCLNALMFVAKEYHEELYAALKQSVEIQRVHALADKSMLATEHERERMIRARLERVETILGMSKIKENSPEVEE